ncbi:MAG TPA: purine-nucleoside phosphorylase [Anaerolineaceae bacterium]|jgi:purine-nucleoside phosphorylase|nr:purine-nucleoside phosphorylase [Anaerolineaceae bacterium]
MREWFTLEEIDESVAAITRRTQRQPTVGIILGSGLGGLADAVESPDSIPFSDITYWPVSTIAGHSGRVLVGQLEGKTVFMMQGRIHYYEGYSMQQVTLPVRVMQRLGVKTLVVTNAAGAIHPDYLPGDVMLISDHIGLMGMTGMNPLRGPNLDTFGPRFPDMSRAYDPDLLELAKTSAAAAGIEVHTGVYIGLSGPSFETPADLRFLRAIGADAVGMSTVPEVTIARHGGMQVLGISGISNKANLDGSTITTHAEVLEAGKIIAPKMETIIRRVLSSL